MGMEHVGAVTVDSHSLPTEVIGEWLDIPR